jgi:anthranilate phosphoribosyltransferase
MVVHSRDGLDEISCGAATDVAELKDGQIRRFSIRPEDFGVRRSPIDCLKVENAEQSLAIIRGVLEDQSGSARDIVMLNAGAAIYTAGLTDNLQQGIEKADGAIASGAARNRLDQLVILTQSFD